MKKDKMDKKHNWTGGKDKRDEKTRERDRKNHEVRGEMNKIWIKKRKHYGRMRNSISRLENKETGEIGKRDEETIARVEEYGKKKEVDKRHNETAE